MSSAAFPGQKSPLLSAKRIIKRFDDVVVLDGVDLELREREIHLLTGPAGSGKSTLLDIFSGHGHSDEGDITYRSYPIRLQNPRDGVRIGIATLRQTSDLVSDFSVVENIFLPQMGRPGMPEAKDIHARAREWLALVGRPDAFSLDGEVRHLPVGQQRLVAIARTLAMRSKLILIDEPTRSLSTSETERLSGVLARLKLSGRGIIMAVRDPAPFLTMADRITVLDKGHVLQSGRTAEIEPHSLQWETSFQRQVTPVPRSKRGEPLLELRGLATEPALKDVSLPLRPGEIVALVGLTGAGQSETLEAVAGLRPRKPGTVWLAGQPLRPHHPRAAIQAGLCLVQGRSASSALALDLSVRENLLLSARILPRSRKADRAEADRALLLTTERLGLDKTVLDLPCSHLPPDLYRRVLLGRALLANPSVLLLDDPFAGIDQDGRTAMAEHLSDLARNGMSVLMTSSDQRDFLGLVDRAVVLSGGRSVADLPQAVLDESLLGLFSTAQGRTRSLLRDLTAENGGVAFWAFIDDRHVVCLDAVIEDQDADPGFRPGRARILAKTRIPQALREREPQFVSEAMSERHTILVPIRTTRGQHYGWIGLSLPQGAHLPHPAAIRFHIESMTFTP